MIHFLLVSTMFFGGFAQNSASAAQDTQGVLTKSTQAVGYQVGRGSTKIDLIGTEILSAAEGQAEVEAKQGATSIKLECKNLVSPTRFGTEFLTYVLWAVSPDGRTANLGELVVNENGSGKREASTPLQMFSLIITAEPYFAVRMPSELVVLENEVRKGTKGKVFIVNNYQLMKKAQYQKKENPLALTMDLKNVPLQMYEARNALEIAALSEAANYAPEIFSKAEASLKMAENALAAKKDKKDIVSQSLQAIQFSEDARALAVERQAEERLANERKASEDAQRAAREKEQQASQRAEESARQKAEADAATATAELERMKAESGRQEALAKEAAATKSARDADLARQRAEQEKALLRAKLLEQFSLVLDTRDTDRGLVVNMSDVLFDTGKYTLRQEAREKLARIAGIVLNYPGLNLEAEGHTDNVGSEELNLKLSQQRADSVRAYLISQGIQETAISASGKGFSIPVAPNDTAAGRQKNRRVELIVSGEVIGTSIGK